MSEAFEIVKTGIDFFCSHLVFFNMLFAIVIVFFQRRDPKSVWAWLLLLYFIPVLGFVFYLLLGQDMHKRKMFRIKEMEDHISKDIRQQEYRLRSRDVQELDENIRGYEDLVMYNLEAGEAMLTKDNDVDIFIDGNEKFRALMEDLRNAEHFIHIQYYIIKNDVLFNQIKDILIEKAAQGVEVRVLFDAMGCRSVRHSYWKWLNEKGVQTAEFFPAILRRLQLRINYRNHRKIVVIDNKVAYVGGFNVGKEYIDLDEKFGHWRDTHLRICGSAVLGLQVRFILDWNYAADENLFLRPELFRGIEAGTRDFCDMQIISSGPDKTTQQIHDNYLRLAAEYDNFRKRTANEKSAIYNNAVSDTVKELLPIADNIERALGQENASAEDMKKGVEMIEHQIQACFEKLGLTEMGKVGEAFDPNLHNAVAHIEDGSLGENVIAAVYQKGYKLGDRVVRHAMVQVAN